MTVVDLVAAVGLIDGLSLGAHLPVVVENDGRELRDLSSDTRNGGLGPLRVELTWSFFETETLALALRPFVTFPTGRARDYLSDNGQITGGAMLQTQVDLGRFRLAGEVGYEELSSDIDVGDLDFDARIRFGLGAEVFLLEATEPAPPDEGGDPSPAAARQPHAVSLGGEVFGWTAADRPFHDEREHPMEALGFLRYRHEGWHLALTAAAGAGLDNGLGAPDYRLVFGVSWTWR